VVMKVSISWAWNWQDSDAMLSIWNLVELLCVVDSLKTSQTAFFSKK
jgi:hypothetical protein